MTPDTINGIFEIGGALLVWLNVHQLMKDKMVKGVHLGPIFFFAVWGYWNMYYYPTLHQWVSFIGGLGLPIANSVWLWLYFKYRGKKA